MPDKKTTRKIATRAGVSEVTVHRALNNCGNVGPCTKARVLQAAEDEGLPFEGQAGERSLGLLVRAKPHFFWDTALHALHEAASAAKIPVALSICSDWRNDNDFFYCLDTLEMRGVNTYIISPISSPAATERLRRLAQEHTVIFLCEDCAVPGSYYVGVDPEQDGTRFAEAVLPRMPEKARVLTIGCGKNPIADRRCDAFLRTVAANLPDSTAVGRVDLDFSASPNTPSLLARILHEQYDDAFDVLFVSQGVLPQVATALYKLRIHRKVLCIGFEPAGRDEAAIENGTVDAIMVQDIDGQARRCIEIVGQLASGQPVPRNNYLPSQIHLYNK